jgi:hypothetical protein
MIVVRKTQGTSYVVAELDGNQSQLRVAGFRLIPYFSRTRTDVPIISDKPDDTSNDDPEDIQFFESLDSDARSYSVVVAPSL